MVGLRCTPLSFLLTGFAWLLLSSFLGIATLIGLVNGTPLPNWLRTIHVHGTLVGGLLQVVIGGFLVSFDHASAHKKSHSASRPPLFLILNGATFALLVSLWLSRWMLAGLVGLVLMGIVASLAKTA